MKRVQAALDISFKKNTKKDWDTWWCVCGDEGKGKTNLELHMLEYYLSKLKDKIIEDDINFLCLDKEDWKKAMSKLKQYEPIVYDEAGELNNRRFMSSFNFEVTQLARVIRGDNNFVVLCIQDFFDLDPFFSKRRIKGLLYVYKRGRVAFWSQNKIKRIIALNKQLYIKNLWIVYPTFVDTFPKYKGVLFDAYMKKKQEFLRKSKERLTEKKENKDSKEVKKFATALFELQEGFGFKNQDIAKVLGYHEKTIPRLKKRYLSDGDEVMKNEP